MTVAWSSPPARLELAEDEIAIWKTILERETSDLATLQETLSEHEKERASRFHFARDRDHFIVARGTLKSLLGQYLGIPARSVRFRYGAQHKPALDTDTPSIDFNISHTQNMAVFAFAHSRRIGIDVEKIQRDFKVEDIAKRYFSSRECQELFSLPAELQSEAFFLCWTRKEAYLKARGEGLHLPLDSFSVRLTPAEPAGFHEGVSSEWQILGLSAADEHPMAVVYDGVPALLRFFTVTP